MKLTVTPTAVVVQTPRKPRKPTNPSGKGLVPFKKGHDPRRNMAGARGPHNLQRFAVMYADALLAPAPAELSATCGKRNATNFEVLIFGMLRAAQSGDTAAAREIREVLEGKLITPYVSASVHAQLENQGALQQARDSLLKALCLDSPDAAPAPPTLEAPAPVAAVPAPPAAQPKPAKGAKGRKGARV